MLVSQTHIYWNFPFPTKRQFNNDQLQKLYLEYFNDTLIAQKQKQKQFKCYFVLLESTINANETETSQRQKQNKIKSTTWYVARYVHLFLIQNTLYC